MNNLLDFFNILKAKNDKAAIEHPHRRQTIGVPRSVGEEVPTLEAGIFRPITPLLRTRFEYAGSWKRAILSLDLLSLDEMMNVLAVPAYRESIEARQEIWGDSFFDSTPLSQISLLGINTTDFEEVYLVWEKERIEPVVFTYIGNIQERFPSIMEFFQYWATGSEPGRSWGPLENK